MAPIRYHDGSTKEATTWVCQMPVVPVPYFSEALTQARKKSVIIGLHYQSRSVVVHFPKEKQCGDAKSQIRTILGKGGAVKDSVERITPFDLFHAESWGLAAVNAPNIPESVGFVEVVDEAENSQVSDLGYQSEVESDAGEALEPVGQELQVTEQVMPDLFALAVPEALAVPSYSRTLGMDTAEQAALRQAFVEDKAGPRLLEELFPRGMAHSKRVREESALQFKAAVDPIHWLGETPEFLTCYHVPTRRRCEYIEWKAERLGHELTPAVCMAIFRQIYNGECEDRRLETFKKCLGKLLALEWKDLQSDERKLITLMNKGKELYHCVACNAVLNAKDEEFCSAHCASQWCCGQRLTTKRVQDLDRFELLQNRLGKYSKHLELAAKLQYKEELAGYTDVHAFSDKFDELHARREERKCCNAHPIFVDDQCKQCSAETSRLTMLQGLFHQKRRGDFNWDVCLRSTEVIQRIRDTPVPMMTLLFCQECEPARKKPRFF